MKTMTIYITTDGRRFDSETEAIRHQCDLVGEGMESLLTFLGVPDELGPKQKLLAHDRLISQPDAAAAELRDLLKRVGALYLNNFGEEEEED